MTDHAKNIQVLRDSLDGAVAGNAALDALLAGHAAEVEQLRQEAAEAESRAEMRCIAHAAVSALNGDCPICDVEQAERERDEARADAETLRQERDDAVEAAAILWTYYLLVLPPEKHARVRDLMGRIEARIAALAAAQEPPASFTPDITHGKPGGKQEPPAECPDCGLDLEPGEKHKLIEGVGCVAQEPPAKGDDRG